MALQFVLGSSGSGKTEYIYERLVRQAGEHPKKNYLVLYRSSLRCRPSRNWWNLHRIMQL